MIKSSSSNNEPCGNPTNTNCITWEGGDIECLGIENGDLLSETISTLATEICELKDTLDLSDLDLKCVFDLCTGCPEPEKTLQNVLELIINKICSLKEIIDNLELSSSTGSDPILNLASCFRFTDSDGDFITELPHTQYTKRIANQVCQILLTISSMQDDISNILIRLDAIDAELDGLDLEIPNVSSDCLYTGTKPISDAWDILDQAFCQIREAVGLPTDINLAISRQCDSLDDDLATEDGWVLNPDNLAESVNNLWIAFCNLRSQVLPCCALSCEDIELGFSAVYNETDDGIIISFTWGAGTSIPSGLEDKGSSGTITDKDGNVISFNIDIVDNAAGNETEIDVSSLNLTGALDIKINAKIGNDDLTCEKCLNKTINKASCGFCTICNSGVDGTITITYDDNGGAQAYESFNPSTTTTTTTVAP